VEWLKVKALHSSHSTTKKKKQKKKLKRTGEEAKEAEYLPSKCEALSSNSSTTKR
jgi:hypothetical protein